MRNEYWCIFQMIVFPWNSKDNRIIVKAMLISQTQTHTHRSLWSRHFCSIWNAWLCSIFCFIAQMKCRTILFCQPCMQSICLSNYSLISFLRRLDTCMCSIVSHAITEILHVSIVNALLFRGGIFCVSILNNCLWKPWLCECYTLNRKWARNWSLVW